MDASRWKEASRRRLASDISSLRRDIEDYLAASAAQTSEAVSGRRERLLGSLARARTGLLAMQRDAAARSRAAAATADEFVHENAWQGVGLAACLGFLAGWLTTRRWS